jgi:hypothetical protein
MAGHIIEEIRGRFNAAAGAVRVVALLSPTCGPCRYGQGVVRALFRSFPDERLAGFVVWVPMLPQDNLDTAMAEQNAITDPRLHFWFDADKAAANEWSRFVGYPQTSWDMYSIHDGDAVWAAGAPPPAPRIWMHQLNTTPATRLEDRLDAGALARKWFALLGKPADGAAELAAVLHANGQAVSARDGSPPHDPRTWAGV